jgi:subtilisin family serine protease
MLHTFWQRIFFYFILAGLLISLAQPAPVQAGLKIARSLLAPDVGNSQSGDADSVQVDAGNKIDSQVLDEMAESGAGDFIIRFTEQADLSPAYAMSWEERGEFVYNTLSEVAARSQAKAKAYLDSQGLSYQTFIAGNDLYVRAGVRKTVLDLAELPEVYYIRSPQTYYIDPVTDASAKMSSSYTWVGDLIANHALVTVELPPTASPDTPQAVMDWGITDTKANLFWRDIGFRGQGIVVANIDTGVQWNHPALINQFKCTGDPGNPACWSDPSNICGTAGACDNNGHGTHTMGTMVSANNPALPYISGMAPDARWIACKGCESNECSDAALLACADWVLAPAGNPANRSNIVNSSWGGGSSDPWYLSKVNAWRAAGIFPAFSAGNTPGCSTIGSPGDYQVSFSSANHDASRVIDYLSSRGPSAFGHTPYTKPNISAPGTNICSTVPNNHWDCTYSGTSMASPHTAGAVALLWSCNPGLIGQVDETFRILQDYADRPTLAGNCGAPPDGEGNYTYGYGYLNVYAAGMAYCNSAGTLKGVVNAEAPGDAVGAPIAGAVIEAAQTLTRTWQTTTDALGAYNLNLINGAYDVRAMAFGYIPTVANDVVITPQMTTTLNFVLEPASWYTVSGQVTDSAVGWPLYARISIQGDPVNPPEPYQEVWTDPVSGEYSIRLPGGITYTFTANAWVSGYLSETEKIAPLTGNVTKDFALQADANSCNAPGYHPGFDWSENFESGDGGFTIFITGTGTTSSWAWGVPARGPGNAHSGSKVWATNLSGNYNNDEYGYLVSPLIDLSANSGQGIQLSWWQWLQTEPDSDYARVEVSNDGGVTWMKVYTGTGDVDLTWTRHQVLLEASFAVATFQVRFHFWSDPSRSFPGWYVDDMSILAGTATVPCVPQPGGLVVGKVYDANTNSSLNGAVVTNDTGFSVISSETGDPAVGSGFYILFSPAGSHHITATMTGGYWPDTETVAVVLNQAVEKDFSLPAGMLNASTQGIQVTLEMGSSTTRQFTLSNKGSSPVEFALQESDRGYAPLQGVSVGVRDLPDGTPHLFSFADVPWLSENPVTGTIPTNLSQVIEVTFNASEPDIGIPGNYLAWLQVNNDAPYGALTIPITMTVLPKVEWGKLTGVVTGLGYCDADPAPLEGAGVLVEATDGITYAMMTDTDGGYGIWLKKVASPLTVTATARGYSVGIQSEVVLTAFMTTTVSFDLRWLQPCVSVEPAELSVYLGPGATYTTTIRLENHGAASSWFSLLEEVSWLVASPITGTIPHDAGLTVTVTFTASPEMVLGEVYTTKLVLSSLDPVASIIEIPTSMHIYLNKVFLPIIRR